jgi:hypothetical protein
VVLGDVEFPVRLEVGLRLQGSGGIALQPVGDFIGRGGQATALEFGRQDRLLDELVPDVVADLLDVLGAERATALLVDSLLHHCQIGLGGNRLTGYRADRSGTAAGDLAPVHAGGNENEHQDDENGGDQLGAAAEKLHHGDYKLRVTVGLKKRP